MSKYSMRDKSMNARDAQIRFLGAILQGIDANPYYAMCECDRWWASVAGIDIEVIYEKARKGTVFETVPYKRMKHSKWDKLEKKVRDALKSNESVSTLL